MRLFFLSRSYLPKVAGGTLIRSKMVDFFKKNNFEVKVITPNYNKKKVEIADSIAYIPLICNLRISYAFERLGIYEDYLDVWVKNSFDYLQGKVSNADIVFATSGGELGCIKLGSLLKKRIGCKFVVNFQDPINYSIVNNLKITDKFHVSREKQEAKYLQNTDLIITSSRVHQLSLQNKYPYFKEKIKCNYFGYIERIKLKDKEFSKKLRIAYGGIFSNVQSPEILAKVAHNIDGVEIYFVGNYQGYKPIKPFLNDFHFIPFMSHDSFLEFMMRNVDVGFLSLFNDYLGACVPSKIYEYINLGLPILGALPKGDALDIINDNKYGIGCKYDDFASLREAIRKLKDEKEYQKLRNNIVRDRDSWSMEERIKEVVLWLKNL